MRGHIADMDALSKICRAHDIMLIEDCAHTMGARWNGTMSGNFGAVACFSTQTYKHLNSGEGGLLTTNDATVAARAVLYSGSYMLYERHGAAPPTDRFEELDLDTPNYSGRMDNLRAAILRPQLELLDANINRWNTLYGVLDDGLRAVDGIIPPRRDPREAFVGSSIQFVLDGLDRSVIPDFLAACAARGVDIKWFGDDHPKAYTSRYDHWRYFGAPPPLPRTLQLLAQTCDMRVPLTFTEDDCRTVTQIIGEEMTSRTVR
jgi:dTDP-4-amino-4,6-dideoxygalactose transaminase